MGISKPIVCEIAYHTYAINEFGMAACFLLWGREKGLLIDCGCGMYNIREIADELCPVPYEVVLTHGHGDHCGSMDKWDEVWIHFADMAMLAPDKLEANKAMLAHYPDMMAAFGSFEAYDIKPEQIAFPEVSPKFKPLPRNHVFHLGGRDVTVIDMPGHTPGEIALIDPFSRIAFTGDACNINLGIRSASIVRALQGMKLLKSYQPQFDRNFNGHIGYGKDTVNRSMPEEVLDECLYILEGVKNETIIPEELPNPMDPQGEPAYVVNYGHTRISFSARSCKYNGLFMNPDQKENVPKELLKRAREKQGRVECVDYTTRAYAKDGHTIEKKCYVYLPPEYDPAKRYPILYLMHGGGDNETYWIVNHDETVIMADNMIAQGLCEETIICTPTFYYRDGTDGKGIDHSLPRTFYEELRKDIIPAVESRYATYANGDTSEESLIASRAKRGFAGLSMGSMTTYWSGLAHCLDIIGYFGPFSGCTGPAGDREEAAEQLRKAIDEDFAPYPIHYLMAVNGTRDIAHDEHVEIMKLLLEKTDKLKEGENYTFIDNEGACHDDQAWEYALYRFLQVFAK